MGIVHKAEQLSLQRPVALKILPAQLTMNERALERFKREASITAQLVHRNIVDIYAVGAAAGVHFIAMELVQGSNLEQLIQRMRGEDFGELSGQAIRDIVSVHPLHGNLDSNLEDKRGSGSKLREVTPSPRKATSSAHSKNYVESVVKLVAQVADGLHHAHQAGVIHRDIKPANILLRADGTPVLTDFGLARAEGLPGVSATGEFAGTPNYVSPEQAMAHRIPVDHRTDIFSLGATLYELLTLELAFGGESIHTVLQKIISKEVRDPTKLNPILAPDLVTIVYKSLEKDPDRRYQSAEEFAEDLRAFIDYRPIHARRTPTALRVLRWAQREPLKALGILTVSIGLPLVIVLFTLLRARSGELELLEGQAETRELKAEVDELLSEGFLAFAERSPDAEEYFAEALEKLPSSVEARAGLVMTRMLFEEWDSAEALLDVEPGEELPTALAIPKAELLRRRGDTDSAQRIEARLADRPEGGESPLELFMQASRILENNPLNALYRRGSSSSQYRGHAALDEEERARATEARKLLDRACRKQDDSALYYYAYAWSLWASDGRNPEAVEYIQDTWPDRPMAHYWVGVALTRSDPMGALASFDRALELEPELWAALEQKVLIILDRGGEGIDPDELESVAERYKALIAERPTYAQGYANLAVIYYFSKNLRKSEEYCRQALALDPDLAEMHDTLGNICYEEGRFEEARQAFSRAVEYAPENPAPRSDLALTLQTLGELDLAIEEFERAVELGPGWADVRANLGLALAQGGRLNEGEEQCRKAVELDDQCSPAWSALGVVLAFAGDAYGAIEAMQEAVELAPDNARYHFSLGDILAAADSLDEAAVHLQRAVDLAPDNDDFFNYLSFLHEQRERPDQLIEAHRRRVAARSDDATAVNDLAWQLVRPEADPSVRNPVEGLELARQARDLAADDDYSILDTYAYALFVNGKQSEALRHQRRALELFEANPTRFTSEPAEVEDLRGQLEEHLALIEAGL